MTTHLASWGKINFQRNRSKAPDSPGGNRASPRKSPARSVSGLPAELCDKVVNNNNSHAGGGIGPQQHARQQTVGAVLTAQQQSEFYQNNSP